MGIQNRNIIEIIIRTLLLRCRSIAGRHLYQVPSDVMYLCRVTYIVSG